MTAGPPPAFVGGTGRSGTTVLSQLIGSDPSYAQIGHELRIHANSDRGLAALLDGRITKAAFGEYARSHWASVDRRRKGRLSKISHRDHFEECLGEFLARVDRTPLAASRRLLRSLLDPVAEGAGKPAWVEMSPGNVAAAPTILKLFPNARIVHVVRDGRDVACSRLKKRELPPAEIGNWIDNWETLLRNAYEGGRLIPPSQLLTIRLEDLIFYDREATLGRLIDFLGVGKGAEMQSYLDAEMPADKGNVGRWEADLGEKLRDRANERYRMAVDRLLTAGVTCAPADGAGFALPRPLPLKRSKSPAGVR